MDHPDPDALLDLFLSLPEERQGLVEHLLSCFHCRTALASVTVACAPSRGEPSPALDRLWSRAQAIEEVFTAEQRKDREESRQLLREVLDLPEDGRLEAVGKEKRYRSASLARRLLQEGEWMAQKDLARAEAFAELAAAVGENLSVLDHLEAPEILLRAACLAADARRLRGDFKGCEESLQEGAKHLRGELLASRKRVRFMRTAALVRRDQHRTDEALALLARTAEILEELEETAELGEVRTEQGWALLEENAPEEALLYLEEGLEKVNADKDPLMGLRARHGLALAMAELGRRDEAERVLEGGKVHEDLLVDPLDRLRTVWMKARIIESCGRDRDAADTLVEAFRGLLAEGYPYEAAGVALDLARVLGRHKSKKRLAELCREVAALRESGAMSAGAGNIVEASLKAPADPMLFGVNMLEGYQEYFRYAHHTLATLRIPFKAPPAAPPEEPQEDAEQAEEG